MKIKPYQDKMGIRIKVRINGNKNKIKSKRT